MSQIPAWTRSDRNFRNHEQEYEPRTWAAEMGPGKSVIPFIAITPNTPSLTSESGFGPRADDVRGVREVLDAPAQLDDLSGLLRRENAVRQIGKLCTRDLYRSLASRGCLSRVRYVFFRTRPSLSSIDMATSSGLTAGSISGTTFAAEINNQVRAPPVS